MEPIAYLYWWEEGHSYFTFCPSCLKEGWSGALEKGLAWPIFLEQVSRFKITCHRMGCGRTFNHNLPEIIGRDYRGYPEHCPSPEELKRG